MVVLHASASAAVTSVAIASVPTAAIRPPIAPLHRQCDRSSRLSCVAAELPLAVSLGAGMAGGAIGVGVAYPLDTLKTKTQSMAGTGSNLFQLTAQIIKTQGVAGFYSGVTSTMAGQALIKGVVFFVYEAAKGYLLAHGVQPAAELGFVDLCLAACASGAVGSLVVTPVERVKCVMQAGEAGTYSSPIECIAALIRSDGLLGLAFRGLGATLLREVPAYALYFVSYDLVKEALLAGASVPAALIPLLGGAVAGAMAWIPVYPIDVVKTQIQVEMDGGDSDGSFLVTARRLWAKGGFAIFWDGIGPKLARAVVNHAVTFYVFDLLCRLWESSAF